VPAVRPPQALSQLLHLQQGDAFLLQLLSSGELLLTPRTRRSRIALTDHLQRLKGRDHNDQSLVEASCHAGWAVFSLTIAATSQR